jgi:translation initiation factor 1
MKQKRRIVYSTDQGRHCPACGEPIARCACNTRQPLRGDGVVRLQRQSKGRNGKPVVVISGLPLAADEMKQLAKRLKAKCAVGGTVENGTIIIQGDKREAIRAELESLDYKVK